ncbi:MAG: hypothetical protein QOH72_5517 [Solirubrobacteraceae bacterium]|jgi:hypothetical protein|nr:hypothetical protein [Solirubrobacteraceae bacterium]
MALPICGAHSKSTGEPCRMAAGQRTDHAGTGRCWLHGGRTPDGRKFAQRQAAAAAASAFGLPIETSPDEALEQELRRCAGTVAYLADYLQRIAPAQRLSGPSAAYVELYERERDRLVRVAKAAIDAGIAERHVAAIERSAEVFAMVLRAVLRDLGVLDHPDAPAVVQRHLALLEGPSDEGAA